MNTYCFIMSTFTLPNNFKHTIHPGVGTHQNDNDPVRIFHSMGIILLQVEYKSYYQWVPFVLFFQACLFHAPHLLFKLAEEGKVEQQRVHPEFWRAREQIILILGIQVSTVLQCLHQRSAILQETNRLPEEKVRQPLMMRSVAPHSTMSNRFLQTTL